MFSQIHGIVQGIKVHHLDLSVDRSIRIVCRIVPPYFKELHCSCKGKKNTKEIIEHYFFGVVSYSQIFAFCKWSWNIYAMKREGWFYLEYYLWACWTGAVLVEGSDGDFG